MERLMLLDGYGLVYRGYFALPPLTTSKGELVNGVFGFASIVLRGIQERTGGIADALSIAPFGLGNRVGQALRSLVVDNAERASRWLLDGGADMGNVRPDDLRDAIGPLVDRLLP